MNQEIEERELLNYQLSFWARLFVAHTYTEILINEREIELTAGKRVFPIGYERLHAPARLVRGQVWTKLLLTMESKQISVAGIPNKVAPLLASAINKRMRHVAADRLRTDAGPLLEVRETIQQHMSAEVYLRASVVASCLTQLSAALKVESQPLWSAFAPPDLREAWSFAAKFRDNHAELVAQHNEAFAARELQRYKDLFDSVESRPLTDSQRQACVVNEDHNLVLAGAGTGKTSTMMGRAGYLLASGQAEADQILMLAFARKAAQEMQERQDLRLRPLGKGAPTVKTFHALGKEVIATVEQRQPALSLFAEDDHAFGRFVDEALRSCLLDPVFRSSLVKFFTRHLYPYRSIFDFKSFEQYNTYVRENELRTLRGEAVKSFEECEIANFLTQHGVDYRYEADYEVSTVTPEFRQYRPDFFLPKQGIYIEHFALNERGQTPPFIEEDRYLKGIKWKREVHAKHKTTLIETYSYQKRQGILLDQLGEQLRAAGVELKRRPDEEVLSELREAGKVSMLAALIADFIKLFKETFRGWHDLMARVRNHADEERFHVLFGVIRPIYDRYQSYLAERREIDFADMIGKAIDYVESGRFVSPYLHVLVDEFQDISQSRARLIRGLLDQRPEAVLFCVGDDWQAIYRFAGSDIGISVQFAQHFGAMAATALDKTFRFNDKIGGVASKFVTKNPAQLKKSIESHHKVPEPAVSLVRIATTTRGVELALKAIQARAAANRRTVSVFILARFHFVLDPWRELLRQPQFARNYPNVTLECMTAHASKGREADYVLVVGLQKGRHGFPSEKASDPLLELLLPSAESFKHAEERRLFYVAMTRAKARVYLIYDTHQASSFVKELEREGYDVCKDEFQIEGIQEEVADVRCPSCGGSLVHRTGKHGSFVGCIHHPYCKHTEKGCGDCNGLMVRDGRFKRCTNARCGRVEPICPRCGGVMVRRNGPHGAFWGCSNFRRNTDYPCTHTEKVIDGR